MAPLIIPSHHQANAQSWQDRTKSTSYEIHHKKPRRSVSFDPTVGIKRIPSRKHYSEEQKASIWLTCEDYKEIRQARLETLELLMSGNYIPNDDEQHGCVLLGLEESSTLASEKKSHELRQRALEAVFSEQDIQANDGYFCEDLIAVSYLEYTDGAHKCAHQRGLKNANDIQVYLIGVTGGDKS